MPLITALYHRQTREAGFEILRPRGYHEYSFVHFSDGIQTEIDRKTVRMPPHSCILWRPQTPQHFFSPTPISHDWFHFTGNIEAFLKEIGLPVDVWLQPTQWFFISEIMEELQDEFFSQKPDRQLLMQYKVRELFIKLSRVLQGTPDDSVSQRMRALRSKMLGDPARPWSTAELAERFAVSPSRFHALYHSLYGTSPIDDLIRARIDIAKYSLTSTDQPVAQIAEELGYRNVSHFSRQFKSFAGTSPQAYRRGHRNNSLTRHHFSDIIKEKSW